MGISADVVLIKRVDNVDDLQDEHVWRLVNTYGDKPIKELRELFGSDTEYVKVKTICYIGSGGDFKKGVLDTYDDDLGLLKLKEGYKFIQEEKWIEVLNHLENHFKTDINYILERDDLYIDLNY